MGQGLTRDAASAATQAVWCCASGVAPAGVDTDPSGRCSRPSSDSKRLRRASSAGLRHASASNTSATASALSPKAASATSHARSTSSCRARDRLRSVVGGVIDEMHAVVQRPERFGGGAAGNEPAPEASAMPPVQEHAPPRLSPGQDLAGHPGDHRRQAPLQMSHAQPGLAEQRSQYERAGHVAGHCGVRQRRDCGHQFGRASEQRRALGPRGIDARDEEAIRAGEHRRRRSGGEPALQRRDVERAQTSRFSLRTVALAAKAAGVPSNTMRPWPMT